MTQIANAAPAENTFQFVDQITHIRGRHTIKAGVEYRPQQYNDFQRLQFGTYNFTGFASGNAWADFLLGIPQTTSRNRPPAAVRALLFLNGLRSGRLQNQLHVHTQLRPSLGLQSARPHKDDIIFNVDPQNGRLVVPNQSIIDRYVNPLFPKAIPIVTASAAGFPERPLRKNDFNNFQPRIGFAWRPSAARRPFSAAGMASLTTTSRPICSRRSTAVRSRSPRRSRTRSPTTHLHSLQRPFLGAGATSNVDVTGIQMSVRNAYAQQWNLTVERDLGASIGLRLSYVGSKSTSLVYQRNVNMPTPSTVPFNQNRRPFRCSATSSCARTAAVTPITRLQRNGTQVVARPLLHGSLYLELSR